MKTNKTKPIKKIMIFTIITVMIVSLFAVPAFASDLPLSELFVPSSGQFYIQPDVGLPYEIDGWYAVVIDYINFHDAAVGGGYYTQYIFDTDEVFNYSVFLLNSEHTIINSKITTSAISFDSNSEEFYCVTNTSQPNSAGMIISECYWVVLAFETYPPNFVNNASTLEVNLFDYAYGDPTQFVTLTTQPITPDPDDPTPPADGEEQGIFAVWTQITQWIVEGLASVSNAFYANGELTLLGYLCIIPLAIGVAFLLIAIIQKFLRLRG